MMYELFYGLNRRPFCMSPDLDFFCLSQSHKRALVHLRYGLQQTEGFVVLTGAPGVGKTLLLGLLISELRKQEVHVANVGNTLMEDNDLLPAILSSFNKPIFEFQLRALISQLEVFLLSNAKSGHRSIIVIDEAQNLSLRSLEILRLLSNLQYQNHSVLQVMLVGDHTLEDIISGPENHLLRQRVALSYQLNPMQLSDTKNYIMHRLTCAGWKADPEIHDDVYTFIHNLSYGLPGEINRYCDRLLMQGMLQKKHVIDEDDVVNLLAEKDNSEQASLAIEYQEIKEPADIESFTEASIIEEKEIEKDEAYSGIEHDFLKEHSKTVDDQKESKSNSEKSPPPEAMIIMLLSYAASLLLAVGLFYAAERLPLEALLERIIASEASELVQQPAETPLVAVE